MHCLKYTTTNKLLALKVENGNLFSVICIIKNDNINSFLYYYARNKSFVSIPVNLVSRNGCCAILLLHLSRKSRVNSQYLTFHLSKDLISNDK